MSEPTPVVYVVDDDASFLTAVSRLLRSADFAVRTFSRAEDFLSELSDSPGCVIADLQMPGLSGLDLQDALTQTGHSLPVIFLTGHGDIPTSVHAMRHGAEDILTKARAQRGPVGRRASRTRPRCSPACRARPPR